MLVEVDEYKKRMKELDEEVLDVEKSSDRLLKEEHNFKRS